MATVGISTKSSINLFSKDFEEPKILQSIVRWSYVFLGVYLLVLVGLFGTTFFLSRESSSLEEENSTLASGVAGLKTQEGLLQTLKSRISLSRDVFTGSASVQTDLVDSLIVGLPGGIELSNIQTNDQGGVILSGRSPNSGLLADFFARLKAQNYSQVTLDSMSTREEGGYSFTLEVKK